MELINNIINNEVFRYIILVFVFVTLILMLINQYIKFNNGMYKYSLIKNVHSGKQDVVIRHKYIPQSTYGHVATYCVWLYINDYKYKFKTAKHLFHIGDRDMKSVSPGVWFYPERNNLAIKFSISGKEVGFTDGKLGGAPAGKKCIFPYKIDWDKLGLNKPTEKDPSMKIFNCKTTADEYSKDGYCPIEVDKNGYVTDIKKFGSCSKKTMDPNINRNLLGPDSKCDIENVPLNRWFHLAITVKDDSSEVYIDGKLVKTCVYENLPIISKGDLWITNKGGFDGRLTEFKIFPYYLTHDDIRTIYNRGPDNKNTLLGARPINIKADIKYVDDTGNEETAVKCNK